MEKRRLMNAWVAPSGDCYHVGYFGHSEFALDYLDTSITDGNRATEQLHNMGWGRVVDWDSNKIFFEPPANRRWSSDQVEAVLELAEITNTRIDWDGNSHMVKIKG